MSEQLAPCPVCNAPCEFGDATELNLDDDCAICAGERCGYSATVKRHAELCRHAEIGKIVESIVAAETGLLTIGRTPCRDGSQVYSAWSGKPLGDELSIPDALRALAVKLGVKENGDA